MKRIFLALLILAISTRSLVAVDVLPRRWVYLQMNLQVAENVEKAKEILTRAEAAGYNGVVLADYKLNILDRVPEFYFDHAREFREHADVLGMEIIPCVAPMGYSDGLLAHDPNLAEGLPVRDAQFIVQNGRAVLVSSLDDPLPGGAFESHRNHTVTGWSFQDEAGTASFVDTDVKHGGDASLRWDNPEGNARVSEVVQVSPWRQYHLSVWIKTEDFSSSREREVVRHGERRLRAVAFQSWRAAQSGLDRTACHIQQSRQQRGSHLLRHVGRQRRSTLDG